jgi:RNA polymerase sigma-70 factor (ECF subfamily)
MKSLTAILPSPATIHWGTRSPRATSARAPEDGQPTARAHSAGRAAAEGDARAASVAADPDRELAGRARGGDAEAFRELVERHRDRVFAVARRIVRSEFDAEEVAQDAFVRAWRALPDFRGESRFGTWLHAIVVRRALDRAEVLGRRRVREQGLDVAPEVATPASGPDPETLRRVRRLDGLMGELNDVQRAAVSLYYYEDQSVERVAEMMSMPENTVKTHLSRARGILREAWMRAEGGA